MKSNQDTDGVWLSIADAAKALGVTKNALSAKGRRGNHPTRLDDKGRISYLVDPSVAAVVGDAEETRADLETLRERARDAFGDDDSEPENIDEDAIEDLIARRVDAYRRKAKKQADRVYKIERTQPFAVCHLGDPHIDDDGCDWPELLRTIRIIKRTPGMYAGSVGDHINNWVGRLQALYRHQTTTEDEAFKLARWLLTTLEWDYVMLGNHDKWNQGVIIFELLAEQCSIKAMEHNEIRIEYSTPGAQPYRICVRHDFKGNSMWNKSHALMRRHKMRPWADLNVAGHRHVWAVNHEESHDGRIETSLRVRGFKNFDEYASTMDFRVDKLGAAITTVHNLTHPVPGERMKIFHDVAEASSYLGWLRSR